MTDALRPGRLVAVVALGLFGALAAGICVQLAYAHAPDLTLSMDVDPRLARGLFPPERAPDGSTFAWTRDQVTLILPGLDRAQPWQFEMRYHGARPNVVDLPDVHVSLDGRPTAHQRSTNAFQELSVALPPDPIKARGARIGIHVSSTAFAGVNDPRHLGILIDEIRVRHAGEGMPWAPTRLVSAAACAGGICGLLFASLGLTARRAAIAVGAVATGQAVIVATGTAPYSPYADALPALAIGVALGTLAAAGIARWWAAAALTRTARLVIAGSGAVLFLKLLLLLHPDLPIGDAVFHAHRFEWVRDGRWIFTSVAPGEYAFPYAVALYVFTLPFSMLVPSVQGVMGLVTLLRVIVAAVDTVAGALLYPVVARSRVRGAGAIDAAERASNDRLAGGIAVALFHALPLNVGVQTVGNLTNAFGQSLFVITLAAMLLGVLRPAAYARLALLALLLAATLLSHTSTFAITWLACLLIAAAFRWRGAPDVRPLAAPLLIVTLVAAAIAIAAYYGRFGETYAAMWQRIGGELSMPAETTDPGGRSIARRIVALPYLFTTYFGWPALALAAMGLFILRRRHALALTLAGWLLAALAFLIVGLLTPIDTRHYLAAFPAIALLGGIGAARAWRRGPVAQSAAIVLLVAAIVLGAQQALATLR